jgi:hypothetical protein
MNDGWTDGERSDLLRHLGDISVHLKELTEAIKGQPDKAFDLAEHSAALMAAEVEALRYLAHVGFEGLCLRHADAVVATDESEQRARTAALRGEKARGLTADGKVARLQAVAMRRLKCPPWNMTEEAANGEQDGNDEHGSDAGAGTEA